MLPGGGLEHGGFGFGIFDFGDLAAKAADQELGGVVVGVPGVAVAADEGVEALDAVNQALGDEKIEGTVDGGRLAAAVARAQAVQQGVGTDGLAGFKDEAKHVAADVGELGAAAGAELLGPGKAVFQAFGGSAFGVHLAPAVIGGFCLRGGGVASRNMAWVECYVIALPMRRLAIQPCMTPRLRVVAGIVCAAVAGFACGGAWAAVPVVAAESVYGSVAQAVGGDAVAVTSILRNPAQDPHLFEADPAVARAVARARLVIANGAGYDPWMVGLLGASPAADRVVLVVADLVHAPEGANPHLWYSPAAMRVVARDVEAALARIDPGAAAEFGAGLGRVAARLDVLDARVAALRARFGGQAVAATEPVFGPMAQALGLVVKDTRFQLAVMNGTEPRSSDVAGIETDLREHRVRALLFNAQVTDASTQRLLGIARNAGVPVVGVSETLPAGEDYVGWMLAELGALEAALSGARP